jgi:hypothetical protein
VYAGDARGLASAKTATGRYLAGEKRRPRTDRAMTAEA